MEWVYQTHCKIPPLELPDLHFILRISGYQLIYIFGIHISYPLTYISFLQLFYLLHTLPRIPLYYNT